MVSGQNRVLAFLAIVSGFVAVCALPSGIERANANWFTKILKEAGEAGGDAARVGGKLGRAGHQLLESPAKIIKKLPERSDRLVIGAHATPEGHWKFVNQKGDVYTAGTPNELARLEKAIAPDGLSANHKVAIYLSEETVFERVGMLKDLPPAAELHVASGSVSYRLLPSSGVIRSPKQLAIQVRPKVHIVAVEQAAFREAAWQLTRPLRKADVRILALEPGAPATLSRSPRFDKTRKVAMVDQVDPDGLVASMSGVRGQTILVTGRVENGALFYPSGSLSEGSIQLRLLKEAAAKADVNLVVLHSSTSRQPGGRNWLWQRVEVDGLTDALKRATFADFLDALGTGRGTYRVTVRNQTNDRVHVEAIPDTTTSAPITDTVGQWVGEIVSSVTGDVVVSALDADLRSKERQKELDARLVPGIPSAYQIMYCISFVMGLAGWSMASSWWRMIWRQDARESYRSGFGWFTARLAEWLLYLFVFLPIVGIPALLVTLLGQLLTLIMMPFWFLRWLFGLVTGRT